MKEQKILMGMPISIEIYDSAAYQVDIDKVFDYLEYVDKTFSTYKTESEITAINRGQVKLSEASADMRSVFELAEETKFLTNGYFDIQTPDGSYDPSGLVKGWAIEKAAEILDDLGYKNFYVEAGGDIQVRSSGKEPRVWNIGLRNPFNPHEIVKVVKLTNEGIATSGTYVRGQHIYNPHKPEAKLSDIASLTVIGPNVYEADRFATAAFAMGKEGINFIENLAGFEGYQIDNRGMATYTSNFEEYLNA